MFVHSKQDKRHPYKGNKKKGVVGFSRTVAAHRERIGGSMDSTMLIASKDHRCESLRDASGRAELVTCTVDWGGNATAVIGDVRINPQRPGRNSRNP